MDLQTNGGKPLTSENVPSIDNLRAHSPQIPDVSRGQPDTSGVYTLPLVAMEARICQLSPLRNDENYVCARAASSARARVRSADRDSLS
jgi:hypothetical protein